MPLSTMPWSKQLPMDKAVPLAQQRAFDALKQHRFFKLIAGGSFTDAPKVAALATLYSLAGVDAIDIAPDPLVLAAVDAALDALPEAVNRPMVMVSLDLDEDPHFRKVRVEPSACTLCNVCVPLCPTEALTLTPNLLEVSVPLCYGCGRCVDDCPVEALVFERLPGLSQPIQVLLSHSRVGAVELHTQHLDRADLERFLSTSGELLAGKLVALCFRRLGSDAAFADRLRAYLQCLSEFLEKPTATADSLSPFPLIIQVDGNPMSGCDDPQASLPALEAARWFLAEKGGQWPWVTISGGINRQTASYLKKPQYQGICGVGMGTMARQAVWSCLGTSNFYDPTGLSLATELVKPFQTA
ncbi:MAG: LdpA C-terminal domain-containing domain [Candidatus Melainabacteria bacterium]|nr:LdpA C-terminal domain-containing domain [Candidatus Melainabacteria bacterium]